MPAPGERSATDRGPVALRGRRRSFGFLADWVRRNYSEGQAKGGMMMSSPTTFRRVAAGTVLVAAPRFGFLGARLIQMADADWERPPELWHGASRAR